MDLGDRWLEKADENRKMLETFDTMQKTTGQEKDAVQKVTDQVHRSAHNAARRYRRMLRWLQEDAAESEKMKLEKPRTCMRLAKATAMSHMRFGDAAEAEATDVEKQALQEARSLLQDALQAGEAANEE